MRDQGIGVAPEEEIGEAGEHGASDLLLGGSRSIDVLPPAPAMGHQPPPLEPREHGGDRGRGQLVALLPQGREHVLGGGLPAIPQHPHEGELLITELGRTGHGGLTG